MRLTPANILTLSRLLLAPVFVILFIEHEMGWALTIFCVAGATDLIDGTVARMLKQHSQGGALLDPIADKMLVQSCFISLAVVGELPWWFVGLAIVRDAMIVGGIYYLERIRAQLPYRPALVSKVATLFQLSVAIMGLVHIWRPTFQIDGVPVGVALTWLVVATAVLIVVSGTNYVSVGIEILKRHRAACA